MATFSATNEKIEAMRWENQDIADVRDVNNQNRLLLRRFYEVLGAMGYVPGAPSAGGSVPAVRTIGGALVPGTVGTADVTVAPGVFLFVPSADPGQPDPNIFAHVVDSAVAVGTASDNLAGGDTRIDLLTVKVDRDILNAADQETRKGRTPANVIVQVTPHKRVRTRATFAYYEGTPGAGDPATPSDEVVIARYTMLDATDVFDSVENLLTATGWLPRSLPGSTSLAQIKTDGEIEANSASTPATIAAADDVLAYESIAIHESAAAATNKMILDVPTGWDAAASGDVTITAVTPGIVARHGTQINGATVVSAIAELLVSTRGNWTPEVNVPSATYSFQSGSWTLDGYWLTLEWVVVWSGGVPGGNLNITNLPYAIGDGDTDTHIYLGGTPVYGVGTVTAPTPAFVYFRAAPLLVADELNVWEGTANFAQTASGTLFGRCRYRVNP